VSDPYPFESDDDEEIRELDLESVDAFADQRITVGDLVGENESWRYGHVIVDEAQDLTPMQWRMIMRRVRGRSLTIVGDLAQRSGPVARSWEQLLPPELHHARRQDLTVNYRSPSEVHALALKVLAAFAPDVAGSTAIRASGHAPRFDAVTDIGAALEPVIDEALGLVGGQIALIASVTRVDELRGMLDTLAALEALEALDADRVHLMAPRDAKGLEFDAVILVEPSQIWERPGGPAELYIALTRATQRLIVLHEQPLPPVLAAH
jgi:DNA helicase IV